jgi:hypothetical protein
MSRTNHRYNLTPGQADQPLNGEAQQLAFEVGSGSDRAADLAEGAPVGPLADERD